MNEVEKRNYYTVAVDLGTTNVVVIVGEKKQDGTFAFRKLVSKPVQGMQAGQISNIVAVGNSIRAALTEVEADLGNRVSQVYTGISGNFIRCENYTDHVFAQDSQSGISQVDVDALYARMNGVQAPENEMIIERIPQNFKIDGHLVDRENLVGAFGRQLSATFQFVLCERTPLKRLQMLFEQLGIEVLGTYPTMLTIVDSIATPEEREEGVAVVNLGGDKTDLTVIHGNTLRYIASIPIGGAAINDDIHTLSIPKQFVEQMKQRYGSAIAEMTERKQLHIPGRRPNNASAILDYNLATAIEARMLDIIDCVKEELRDSGYGKRLGYGLILAGGGSRLANVAELFRRETGLDVRLAATDQINREKGEPESKPAYATALGIFMRGVEDGRSTITGSPRQRPEAPAESPAETAQTPAPAPAAEVVTPVQERSSRQVAAQQQQQGPVTLNSPQTATAAPAPTPVPPPAAAPQTVPPAVKPVPKPAVPVNDAEEEKPATAAAAADSADRPFDGGGTTGIYGQTFKIKGSAPEPAQDDEEEDIDPEDFDEPKRGGLFKRFIGAIKRKVEDSFDEGDDAY